MCSDIFDIKRLHLTPTDKSIIKEKADLVGMNMTNYLTVCAIVEMIYCVGRRMKLKSALMMLRIPTSDILILA